MTLADWMTKYGFDDAKFGDRVGVDRSAISRIRRGVNRPSWELAARIKVATGGKVSPDEFLPGLEAAE